MTDWRERARELAIQALAQLDVQGDDFLSEVDFFINSSNFPESSKKLARKLVDITWSNRKKCDEYIGKTVKHWQIQRIALIDRTILRLAIAELLYRPEVPMRVILDQAIELVKKYSTAESPQFINGILDAVVRKMEHESRQESKQESVEENTQGNNENYKQEHKEEEEDKREEKKEDNRESKQ